MVAAMRHPTRGFRAWCGAPGLIFYPVPDIAIDKHPMGCYAVYSVTGIGLVRLINKIRVVANLQFPAASGITGDINPIVEIGPAVRDTRQFQEYHHRGDIVLADDYRVFSCL